MIITFSEEENAKVESVRKCLNTILSTRKGTLALDRDFGLSWDWLDLPISQAMAQLSTEILEQVTKYEPRAKINKITFDGNDAGQLAPKLEVSIK